MATYKNRVKEKLRKGEPSFGVHVKMPAPQLVDVAGNTGSEFVKFDQYHTPFGPEVMTAMVAAARANNLTPWVRCRNDPHEIMSMLDAGMEAITVPSINTVAEAQALVAATRYFPKGVRESNRPISRRGMTDADYYKWADEEILVCASIETAAGLENYKEIIRTDGIDVIATGRGDIALALGIKENHYFHPAVIEAQKRVLMDALDAGKEVSMTYTCTPRSIEDAQYWIEQGIRVITLETEHRVLARAYSSTFEAIQAGISKKAAS